MSIRPRLTVAPDQNATPSLKLSLAEEVGELRKLASDRRTASLALFRNSTKHPALQRINVPPRGRERVAA
jgi:hypothetical protein